MENNKQKLEEAGAFWVRSSKSGTQFLSGKVKTKSGEEISVIVFKNKYKTEGSNQPDYRVYFDTPASEGQPKTETKNAGASTTQTAKTEEIPF
jgi:uncharacterized protein (DUF736 family)